MTLTSLKLTVARLPPWSRELLIFLAFVLLTSLMTWPWVINLRDYVSDPGDPYMIAWTLWWDFHQTFHDPLHLFQANVFYPLQSTLAFSEHDYGIAVFCFPLFAIGLRPLTVHSIITFAGIAFCGYATFRLTRTLTKSNWAAWIAGAVFAFIPFRFALLSHLHYMFAGWIPLLLEAVVLFLRERTWKRATWLGFAFLMNALTCITWMMLTALPLTLTALFLVVRYWREKDNRQILRAAPPLLVACLLLTPFMWPYYKVKELYHFEWTIQEITRLSAGWSDWFSAEPRNRVWSGFGDTLPGFSNRLFPGLLPLLLSVGAIFLVNRVAQGQTPVDDIPSQKKRWLVLLDVLSILAVVIAVLAVGYHDAGIRLLAGPTSDRALVVFLLLLITRWSIAYPKILLRSSNRNLIETIRSAGRGEAYWIAAIWMVVGFFNSLGVSFFVNRVVNEFLTPFRSLRMPARAAMVCYVGLAVMAGLGAKQLARVVNEWKPGVKRWAVCAVILFAVLFELHTTPLKLVHGEVDTDGVSQRLKTLNMRGGVVELPGSLPAQYPLHLAMLRSADHGKPLINGASTFLSPYSTTIDSYVHGPGIKPELMDLLEQVPTSYVVVRNHFISPDRQKDFAGFFNTNVAAGRLRLVGKYDSDIDLYVVTKTEPQER